jgi:hypothetical protein
MGQRTSQIDRAMALRDAVAQAMESEQSFKRKPTSEVSRARMVALLAVMIPLLALSAYTWLARPASIWGPPLSSKPQAESEANLRAAMFFLGMRLDSYREEQGFYPASLDVLGETLPGVSYELVTDSTFELRGVVGQQPVIFRSDMTADEFLGHTKELIAGPTRRR